MILNTLRRWWRKLFGKPEEPRPVRRTPAKPFRRDPRPTLLEPRRPPRGGIRSTDLGMRKLSRHRAGRLYDRRSGFDPDKRMVDIEDDQTRKRKKKKSWAVDRKR